MLLPFAGWAVTGATHFRQIPRFDLVVQDNPFAGTREYAGLQVLQAGRRREVPPHRRRD